MFFWESSPIRETINILSVNSSFSKDWNLQLPRFGILDPSTIYIQPPVSSMCLKLSYQIKLFFTL